MERLIYHSRGASEPSESAIVGELCGPHGQTRERDLEGTHTAGASRWGHHFK